MKRNGLFASDARPRVAFLSIEDSSQPNLRSGGFHGMRGGFKEIGCEVIDVFPIRPRTKPSWLIEKVARRLKGEFHHWDREPEFLRQVGEIASNKIKQADPDFVMAVQSPACTNLDVDVPVVLTHDQTFLELKSYFPFEPRPRSSRYVEQALEQEHAAFQAADLIIYPSVQSCQTVAQMPGIAAEKLRMVPWGGNVPQVPSGAEVQQSIQARGSKTIVLTAIGVHWDRKGGDVILAAYQALKESGRRVRLNVVGMTPPTKVDDGVHIIPFLDKSDPRQAPAFARLLASTHFLIAPSRVEAFGHIFGEAAAFGVPAIASNVGGIPTSIDDHVNGRLLPLTATGQDYARAILDCLEPVERYREMAGASRERFELDLNWPAFATTVVDEVAKKWGQPRASVQASR